MAPITSASADVISLNIGPCGWNATSCKSVLDLLTSAAPSVMFLQDVRTPAQFRRRISNAVQRSNLHYTVIVDGFREGKAISLLW